MQCGVLTFEEDGGVYKRKLVRECKVFHDFTSVHSYFQVLKVLTEKVDKNFPGKVPIDVEIEGLGGNGFEANGLLDKYTFTTALIMKSSCKVNLVNGPKYREYMVYRDERMNEQLGISDKSISNVETVAIGTKSSYSGQQKGGLADLETDRLVSTVPRYGSGVGPSFAKSHVGQLQQMFPTVAKSLASKPVQMKKSVPSSTVTSASQNYDDFDIELPPLPSPPKRKKADIKPGSIPVIVSDEDDAASKRNLPRVSPQPVESPDRYANWEEGQREFERQRDLDQKDHEYALGSESGQKDGINLESFIKLCTEMKESYPERWAELFAGKCACSNVLSCSGEDFGTGLAKSTNQNTLKSLVESGVKRPLIALRRTLLESLPKVLPYKLTDDDLHVSLSGPKSSMKLKELVKMAIREYNQEMRAEKNDDGDDTEDMESEDGENDAIEGDEV